MKVILMFILLSFLPAYASHNTMPQDIGYELSQEGFFSKRRAKRIVERHVNLNSRDIADRVRMILEESKEEKRPSEFLRDILTKVFGPELAEFLLEVTSIPEVEGHLYGLVLDWRLLRDKETCEKGMELVVGHLVYVGAVAAVIYYSPLKYHYLALQMGTIAQKVSTFIVNVSRFNKAFCRWAHE